MSTKNSYILKEYFTFQLQICLSMYDLLDISISLILYLTVEYQLCKTFLLVPTEVGS